MNFFSRFCFRYIRTILTIGLLGVLPFILGCPATTDTSQTANPDDSGAAASKDPAQSMLSLPKPEILNTIGDATDLDPRWLLSNPNIVFWGQPHRFISSPLGTGNDGLIAGFLSDFIQLPFNYRMAESFVQSNQPVYFVVVENNGQRQQMALTRRSTVIRLTEPTTPEQFFAQLLNQNFSEIPKAKYGDIEYFDLSPKVDNIPQRFAVHFPDDRTAVIVEGNQETLGEIFGNTRPSVPSAAHERLRRMNRTNLDLGFILTKEGVPLPNEEILMLLMQFGVPENLSQQISKDFRAAMIQLNTAAAVGENLLTLRLESTNAKTSQEIAETLQGFVLTGRIALTNLDDATKQYLRGSESVAKSFLESITVAQGTTEHDSTCVTGTLVKFAEFDQTASQGLRFQQQEIKKRQLMTQRDNQLTVLQNACFAYYQANKKFPTNIVSADGTPLLSWRISLLPLLGQEELYRQFKFDEPWDSPANKSLLEKMPGVFKIIPLDEQSVSGEKTMVRFFNSEGTLLAKPDLKAEAIRQPELTFHLVYVAPGHAIEWTKPDWLVYDDNKIEELFGDTFLGIMFDRRIMRFPLLPKSDPRYDDQRKFISNGVNP